MNTLKEKLHLPGINGNTLKLIAMVTMLIDHIGAALLENGILGGPYNFDHAAIEASETLTYWWNVDMWLRGIGRISFPIYCFLLVEGFIHTRDVKKYALRLLAFCLISEIPFDLAIFHSPFYLEYQNVFFTLLLGLLALWGVQACERDYLADGQLQDVARRSVWGLKTAAVVAVCCGVAWILRTDYDMIGVCLIVLFYMVRGNRQMQILMAVMMFFWEPQSVLAWIPICMYDGSRGKGKWKYLFYGFYPVHLLILWGINRMLFG